jgi:hypothetical protein
VGLAECVPEDEVSVDEVSVGFRPGRQAIGVGALVGIISGGEPLPGIEGGNPETVRTVSIFVSFHAVGSRSVQLVIATGAARATARPDCRGILRGSPSGFLVRFAAVIQFLRASGTAPA